MARVRIGVIGWDYPEWKGLAYPADARRQELLQHYARTFDAVEAASSFYGMPKTDVVARWAAQTPEGFELSLKVPDWILKKRHDDPDLPRALATLVEHLDPLRREEKLGTLVAQFPPFFRRETQAMQLEGFVAALPQGVRWAVELRHASWWTEETYETLRAREVALVWSDTAKLRTPAVATTDRLYLRLFGDRELEAPYDRKRRDASDALSLWVERIRVEGRGARRVDVMVSKYLEGYAPGTVATMCEMLGLREPAVGPREGRHETRQTTLAGL